MSLDGLLTFLGLLAASFAIMSPVDRLRLELVTTRLTMWSIIFLVGILYLEFFDLLALRCPSVLSGYCIVLTKDGSFTPQQGAFVVVLVWLGFLVYARLRPRVRPEGLPTLRLLIDRLLETGAYSDLIDLVERHLGFIDACASGNLPFQLRRKRLVGVPVDIVISGGPAELFGEESGSKLKPTGLEALKVRWAAERQRLRRRLGSVIPEMSRARMEATSVMDIMLRSPRLVDFIAEHRPRFGSRLLLLRSELVADYSENFLDWQISHRESSLYREIRRLDDPVGCAHEIFDDSPVLAALFRDINVARRLEPYRPIGERVIAMLNPVIGCSRVGEPFPNVIASSQSGITSLTIGCLSTVRLLRQYRAAIRRPSAARSMRCQPDGVSRARHLWALP